MQLFRIQPLSLLLPIVFATAAWAQQPSISMLQNNYSYLLPSDPNYGIAQGSIFIIKGSNLANTSTPLQNVPLGTNLNGVTAQVNVNGTATNVIWYYVTPGQLGGILPSSTPVGTGTITVTNNGLTSAPAQIKVVQSAFGTLTLDGSGTGAAAVYDVNYQFLTASHSAKPGDVIQLFGTGVGPVSGDETLQQAQVNLTNLPITVEIGGIAGTVAYRGRTIFPGLDQINVVVPNGVTFGCNVSLVVKTGGLASNSTTIPVASNGGTCPVNNTGGGSGNTSVSQTEINQWIAAGVFRTGGLGLTRQTSYSVTDSFTGGPPTVTVTRSDVFSANFYKITGADLPKLFNSTFYVPVEGDCIVTDGTLANPYPNLNYASLDAGTQLSVSGPAGVKTAPRSVNSIGNIEYVATVGTGDPGNYLDAGSYTFNGPGGPDVGSFSGTINVAPELLWTNRASLMTVDRAQPVTLTWSGGEPSTLVTIQGSSFSTQGTTVTSVVFQCWAKNTDGHFTVPVSVLSRLPASQKITAGTISITQRGSLAIGSVGTGTRMQATGIDYLTGGNQWGIAQTTEFK